ncbi:MAG: hypothetical protein ABIH70_00585 [Chloroflexota bacterium]
MKKILVAITLVLCLLLTFSMPLAAANGPPMSVSGDIILSEEIGGILITVCGGTPNFPIPGTPATGTFTGHILRPASSIALEESWFRVTAFSGWIIIGSLNSPIAAHYYSFEGTIQVLVHNGTQTNQPVISIRSSEPIFVPILNASASNIQMVGWGNIVHAK